ncbi:Tfp pilus assembly protein [Bifidobacterium pseudolongum subsp. pseudolongum]|uniref:variant leucine-rich repeat-containing protein n=1 Tax=Bifidobacterium pseudolongum TaxID=1694 RepID=UPI000CA93BC4|nr:FHA domain-containing protein [Bifidobacterium pseudolongum]PKV00460.1 Tfp pilus assembly protein [Bifidobacterium pseudolongum subsp. pseudolongum]
MSGDQRATTKWMIRVDGSDLTSVEAGQTVEIGRKPLRPLSDDGTTRVEILDDTRSMSKRHAEFSVKSDGNAILRDMNSTNGTYLVRPGNDLVRLPSGSDFALTDDTVRLQFGDVPVDFVRFIDDSTTHSDDPAVANLFDYALDNVASEPEASELSVDDILNLRAGEPTNIFDSNSVRTRAHELREAEQQTFVPFAQPINPVTTNDAVEEDAPDAAPRDLFADAHDVAAGKIDEPAVKKEEFVPRMHDGPRHAGGRPADRLISVDELGKPRLPDIMPLQMTPQQPAIAQPAVQQDPANQQTAAQPAPAQEPQPAAQAAAPAVEHDTQPMVQRPQEQQGQEQRRFAEQSTALDFEVLTTSLHAEHRDEPVAVDVQSAVAVNQQSNEQQPTPNTTAVEQSVQAEQPVQTVQPVQSAQTAQPLQTVQAQPTPAAADVDARFKPTAQTGEVDQPEQTQAFTPAFEPGSVFERVAKGEFNQREELVEAGGYNSDQARRSDDFAEQFEMARHAELLPFLAMNPALYDDLYAWLAAQGNADVDKALSANPGYEDYRKAMGK